MPNKHIDIKILGAGVGGFSCAIALRQQGFQVQIFERHREPQQLGAGVVLWPNASFILEKWGLLADILRHAGKPVNMRRISHKGMALGTLDIQRLNSLMHYPSISILRKDLMKVLEFHLNKLGVVVQYDRQVEKLLPSKTGQTSILFNNGMRTTADIIIGADGRMSSVARDFVLGHNKPTYQGFINWIGITQSPSAIFSRLEILDFWGIGKRFGIVPISPHKTYWAGGVAAHTIGSNHSTKYKAELLSHFQHWPAPIPRTIFESTLDSINKIYVHDHEPTDCWHKDNVLIIGDAAHAPLPTSGQGACQAIEDGWHLGKLFSEEHTHLQSVFRKFTKLRFAKTQQITLGARQLASSLFNQDDAFCRQRNENSINSDFTAMANGMAKTWSEGLTMDF